MAALPLHPHVWHGEWNHTLDPTSSHPPPRTTRPATTPPRPPAEPAATPAAGAPALTGMSTQDFTSLAEQLVAPYTAYRAAELHVRHGGPSWRKPAGGHPRAFTLPEMLLITVLRARFRIPQPVLAELFGVSTPTIAKADRQIKPSSTSANTRSHPPAPGCAPSPNSPTTRPATASPSPHAPSGASIRGGSEPGSAPARRESDGARGGRSCHLAQLGSPPRFAVSAIIFVTACGRWYA